MAVAAHYRVIHVDSPAEIAYIYHRATSRGGFVASRAPQGVRMGSLIFLLLQILNQHEIGFSFGTNKL